MSAPLLQLKQIEYSIGGRTLFHELDLSVEARARLCSVGRNGSGKSTLMKIITCFIKPTSGTVKVNDFDVLENPLEVRKILGYLPEHNPLYLDMYVHEYLNFCASLHKLRGRKAKERIALGYDHTLFLPEIW